MDVALLVGTVISAYTDLYGMLSRDKCHEEKEAKGVERNSGNILVKWQFGELKYKRTVKEWRRLCGLRTPAPESPPGQGVRGQHSLGRVGSMLLIQGPGWFLAPSGPSQSLWLPLPGSTCQNCLQGRAGCWLTVNRYLSFQGSSSLILFKISWSHCVFLARGGLRRLAWGAMGSVGVPSAWDCCSARPFFRTLGLHGFGVESQLCHLLAPWPWASAVTSVSVSV